MVKRVLKATAPVCECEDCTLESLIEVEAELKAWIEEYVKIELQLSLINKILGD